MTVHTIIAEKKRVRQCVKRLSTDFTDRDGFLRTVAELVDNRVDCCPILTNHGVPGNAAVYKFGG